MPFVPFEEYSEMLKRCLLTKRENGILEARLHTDGDSMQWAPRRSADMARTPVKRQSPATRSEETGEKARRRDAARSLRPSVSLICGDLRAPRHLSVAGGARL